MNILFVIPPSPFLIDEKSLPHLGILSVANVTKTYTEYPINVLDLSGIENYEETFSIVLNHKKFDIIGFTSSTPQYPHVIELIKHIPQEVKKILGGPHATSCFSPQNQNQRIETNKNHMLNNFDTIFIGDGELSILNYLNNKLFDNKIIDANTDKRLFLTNVQLDKLPFSNRNLVDLKSYHFFIDEEPCTSIISQLGCPFNCAFCCGRFSNNLRKIRNRSVDSVVKEVEFLYKTYGYKSFMFYDDELNVNKNLPLLLKKLIEFQNTLNIKFTFRGFIKSELFNEEQASLMEICGFRWLLCGFESANDRILVNINKKSNKEDNENVVRLCKKYNIKIKALMSCGHPGETKKSILDIKDWLITNKVEDMDLSIITPYPGSHYYDLSTHKYDDVWEYEAMKTKDKLYSINIDYSKTSQFYKGIPRNYKSYVFTDFINSEEIVKCRDIVEQEVKFKLDITNNVNITNTRVKFNNVIGSVLR
jgi:radical SAM superfamily enzyme YgiQ (UPF0313 family)